MCRAKRASKASRDRMTYRAKQREQTKRRNVIDSARAHTDGWREGRAGTRNIHSIPSRARLAGLLWRVSWMYLQLTA